MAATLKKRFDALLDRIVIGGRPLSLHRLKCLLDRVLTRLFGREIELDDSGGKKLRVFPIIWGKKIHLLGVEHTVVQAYFTSQYTLGLKLRPFLEITPGEKNPTDSSTSPPSIAHVVLGHIAGGPMDQILTYTQSLAPEYHVVLAYGGTTGNFEQVRYLRKFFVEDNSVRGSIYYVSYFGLMAQIRAYLSQNGMDPDWIFISDYDLLPLKEAYLEGLVGLMKTHGCGFGGKLIQDISHSNDTFLTRGISDGAMHKNLDLNEAGKKPVYHSLGCGYVLHRDCFNAVMKHKDEMGGMFFEVVVPTLAALEGYRLLGFDNFSKDFEHVKYRPVLSPVEALRLAEAGAAFIHPLKDSSSFIETWSGRRAKNRSSVHSVIPSKFPP